MTITEMLRKIIEDENYTINSLATAAGLPQPVLSRFMHGQTSMNGESLDKLAAYLGVELKQVIQWDEYIGELRENGVIEEAWQEFERGLWKEFCVEAWPHHTRTAWKPHVEAAWEEYAKGAWEEYRAKAWADALSGGEWTALDFEEWSKTARKDWKTEHYPEWEKRERAKWEKEGYEAWYQKVYPSWYKMEYAEWEAEYFQEVRRELEGRGYVILLGAPEPEIDDCGPPDGDCDDSKTGPFLLDSENV